MGNTHQQLLKVHEAGCVTPQHFMKKQGSAWDVTASDKKWQQDLGLEHFGKIRYEKQNSLRGSYLGIEVIAFFKRDFPSVPIFLQTCLTRR